MFSSLRTRLASLLSGRSRVGMDLYGNTYYEELGAHAGRSRRTVIVKGARSAENMSPDAYDTRLIPVQWKSWLSHTRSDAPSNEEIAADMELRETIRQRAQDLDEKWAQRKAELGKEKESETSPRKIRVDFEAVLRQNPTESRKRS